MDLGYVTPRLIALAAPVGDAAGASELARFLRERHAGCARVFALSPDTADAALYWAGGVEGVQAAAFGEHDAPPLALLAQLADAVHAHLDAGAHNVAVLACSDGATRAGVVAAACILREGVATDAAGACTAFAAARTRDARGLRLASHRRYVAHYAAQLAAAGAAAGAGADASGAGADAPPQRCLEARLKLASTATPPVLKLWQRAPSGVLAVVPGCALRPHFARCTMLTVRCRRCAAARRCACRALAPTQCTPCPPQSRRCRATCA